MAEITHGHTVGRVQSSTYTGWAGMWQRCTNPDHVGWERYGGRGIMVCERWRSFDNFLADMGERPPGLTLERIDNDGPYAPDNCKWATRREQAQNRRPARTQRMLTFNGRTQCMQAWADEFGMSVDTLNYRLKRGSWGPPIS